MGVSWLLLSESQIYRFYDKKVVICHPLCHNKYVEASGYTIEVPERHQ